MTERKRVTRGLHHGPFTLASNVPAYVSLLTQRISVVRVANLHHESDPDDEGHTHEHRAYGTYEEATQVISLDDQLGFERERETFLHENLHAILAIGQLDSLIEGSAPGLSEHLVGALAPIMLSWLRENPEVVAYLQEVQA